MIKKFWYIILTISRVDYLKFGPAFLSRHSNESHKAPKANILKLWSLDP